MVHIYKSRYTPGLKPGDGHWIDWSIGERTLVIDGIDKGRIFVVDSERKSHAALPDGEYVREGHFEDDESATRWAKAEKVLWFA